MLILIRSKRHIKCLIPQRIHQLKDPTLVFDKDQGGVPALTQIHFVAPHSSNYLSHLRFSQTRVCLCCKRAADYPQERNYGS